MSVSVRANALVRQFQAAPQPLLRSVVPPAAAPQAPPVPAAVAPAPAPERQPASALTVKSSRLVAASQHHALMRQHTLQNAPVGAVVGPARSTSGTMAAVGAAAGARTAKDTQEPEGGADVTFLEAGGGAGESGGGSSGSLSRFGLTHGSTLQSRRSVTAARDGHVVARTREDTHTTTGRTGGYTFTERAAQDAAGRTLNTVTHAETVRAQGTTTTQTQRLSTATTAGGERLDSQRDTRAVQQGRQTDTDTQTRTSSANGTAAGPPRTQTSRTETQAPQTVAQRARQLADDHTDAALTLLSAEVGTSTQAAQATWGQARELGGEQTGARAELAVARFSATGTAGAEVDLRKRSVTLSARGEVAVDVLDARARAQAGNATTVRGQVFAEATARVGARAGVGADLTLDPRKGTARVGVGGDAFAGAEVTVRGGYQNRYGGVDAEASGRAGAGVTARAEVAYDRGVLRANLDLGAVVGLGGRLRLNATVNTGAILTDAAGAATRALAPAAQLATRATERGLQALLPTARRTLGTVARHGAQAYREGARRLRGGERVLHQGVQTARRTMTQGTRALGHGVQQVQAQGQRALHGLASGYQAAHSWVRSWF